MTKLPKNRTGSGSISPYCAAASPTRRPGPSFFGEAEDRAADQTRGRVERCQVCSQWFDLQSRHCRRFPTQEVASQRVADKNSAGFH
jgi:hypothetical protein